MTDTLPPGIAADRALVQQFCDNAKPGEIPTVAVQAAQARCARWLDESRKPATAQQPQLSAVDRFKAMPRSDTPPTMPAWKDQRPQLPEGRWRNPRSST
jgi:hypothetical protein